jgi:hypothetical protein
VDLKYYFRVEVSSIEDNYELIEKAKYFQELQGDKD